MGEEVEEVELQEGKEPSLEEMIAAHSEGAPAPEVHEAKVIQPEKSPDDKAKEASSSRSEFKKHFLDDGFLSGLILNIFVTIFAWGNGMIYNMVFKNKRHVEWRDLKPEEGSEDETEINDLIDLYAPKIMTFLDALPDEVLMLVFIEYGFITRLSLVSKEIEPKKEEEENKESAEEMKPKIFYVITRKESPVYWKDGNDYTDKLEEAHHFDSNETATLAKNNNETITSWKKKNTV